MCYELAISTTAPIDLTRLNKVDVFFEQTVAEQDKTNLHYPNCYRIATAIPNSCSCHLRIFNKDMAKVVRFCPLMEWMDELPDDEEILDTQWLFQIIKNLVNDGYKVDSYVSWSEQSKSAEKMLTVNVNELIKSHFAFFENERFEYVG